ncbi:MAG: CoA transferase [Betaproteobacteria bacterium]|nr:CoA transferase [Betaproteobacteria bacterium]
MTEPNTIDPATPADPALKGLRVLDLTRVRAGPTCVRMLADFGADVIKIESPPGVDPNESMGGPRDGGDFQNLHRNKRSMTLNLKTEEGRGIFMRLAKDTDVVAENYRPDVKFRLGIDYESLRAVNPRIILASVSGFGQDGPYRNRPGFDQIAQGMGGLMAITGLPGQGPVRAGIAVADSSSGLYAALGVFIALLERARTGQGQWVQASLLQSQIAMLDFQAARYLVSGEVPGQAGNDHPTSIPTGVFETEDGHINIATAGEGQWRQLCTALGLEELLENPDFQSEQLRSKHRVAVNTALSEATRSFTSQALIDLLNGVGVPCGPIYRVDEMFADPQVQHLGAAAPVRHPRLGDIRLVAQPVKLTRTPARIETAAPDAGEHTDAILHDLGYTDPQITDLRARKVV